MAEYIEPVPFSEDDDRKLRLGLATGCSLADLRTFLPTRTRAVLRGRIKMLGLTAPASRPTCNTRKAVWKRQPSC